MLSDMQAMGIDIGGSGIKGATVDLSRGQLATSRLRVPTPQPSTPGHVMEAVEDLVAQNGWDGPLGITVPGVVHNGEMLTAANIDKGWVDRDVESEFGETLGRRVSVLNDADAAGLAEARFGRGANFQGVIILLTFGTGIGSALVHNGKLVPNTELGHLEFHGGLAEQYAAGRLVKRESMRLDWWAERVNEFLSYVEVLFTPDRIIIGGGISKRFADFEQYLTTRAELVPAELRNNAGIVGAALYAMEETE